MRPAIVIVLAGGLWQAPAIAALSASAILTPQQLRPDSWRYSITLYDTGSTSIGMWWFAWAPSENFMPTAPTNIMPPPGWSSSDTNFGSSDGHAILWTPTTPLGPGESLGGFQFDSASSPAELAGNSPFYPGTPVGTSFAWPAPPTGEDPFKFVARTVPPGDADEDGKVDFADLVVLARNYGMTSAAWADGDFNLDGAVGFDDLVILARNYGQTLSAVQVSQLGPALRLDVQRAFDDVPEPSAFSLLAFIAAGLLERRRRLDRRPQMATVAIQTGPNLQR